ncbi:MAG TPA: Ig-like domain-containing protein [Solirubrobacteraceae bacterium]|nr:Ig-like domain-containing protein [Solirubrobacteraceae bacterium]
MRRFRHFTKVALVALVTGAGTLVLTAAAQAAGPTNTTPPSIAGTPEVGHMLTEREGQWNGSPPVSITVQWEDCTNSTATTCRDIPNTPTTPNSTYTLVPGDVGSFVVVVETVTDANGTASSRSAPVGIVTTTSTTAITVSPQPSITNQAVTLVGTVTAGPGSVGPSGTLAFLSGGTPIAGCNGIPVSPTGQVVTIVCQTTFGAAAAQLSAIFAPNPGAAVAGSSSPVDVLSVSRDSTATSLYVPKTIIAGEPTTFIAQVSPPAARPGPREPTGAVEFLNGGKPIKGCLAQPIGPTGATCTVTYDSTGTRAITARYQGDSNFDPSASRPLTPRVVARARITSTMRWSFFVTPTYTRIISLMLRGAAHTRVMVTCHGKGCPFSRRVLSVNRPTRCKRKAHGRCHQTKRSAKTINLARVFGSRRLRVGARIAVAITRPGWVGKYYAFTTRSSRVPRVQISCLPPGATRPAKGC